MMSNEEKILRDKLELKTDGNSNYSIMAGAGGGKTTLLGKRICEQILSGTPIEKFVVITYTNAAAAELRDKISKSLQDALDFGELDEAQKQTAIDALNSLELMQISTIHSFLLKLLRECSFESGISIDATLIEGNEEIERRRSFFYKFYNENYEKIKDVVSWKSSDGYTDHKEDAYLNMFLDVAGFRGTMVCADKDQIDAKLKEHADEYVKKWLSVADSYIDRLNSNPYKPPKSKKDSSPKESKFAQENSDMIYDLDCKLSRGERFTVEDAKNLSFVIKRAVGDYHYVKTKPRDENIWEAADEEMREYAADNIIPLLPENNYEWNYEEYYKRFANDALEANEAAKFVDSMRIAYQKEIDQNTSELSDDEILYRAEKLLIEYPEILNRFRNRYSKIYVDEFQDTTNTQANVIMILSEEVNSKPDEYILVDDKLIVVGDPKQSIYRFNGAELSIYKDIDAKMGDPARANSEAVRLNENFRSNSKIVEWVNSSFRDRIAGYSDMHSSWDVDANESLHGVFQYVPETDENDEPIISGDPEQVVDLVKRLVEDEHYYLEKRRKVRDDDGEEVEIKELHRIQYKDFMIVTKWTYNITSYVNCFAKAGIPISVQGKIYVSDNEVLKNFVYLLDYLSESRNKRKKIEAYQVFSGLDLTQYETEPIRKEWKNIWDDLKNHNIFDVPSITNYLLMHEEYFYPKGIALSKERVRDCRIKLHQMVENCLSLNCGGLSELSQLMKDYLNSEIKHEIALESDANAVRFMNCHQAKGLTGQIVIICDRSSDEAPRYSGFRNGDKYYATVSYKHNSYNPGQSKSKVAPAYGYDYDLLMFAGKEEMDEMIRLQYVAATRAEHALIIMPALKSRTWFTDPAYDYDNLDDINVWSANQKANTVPSGLIGATDGLDKTIRLSNLEAELSNDNSSLCGMQLVNISPSGLELDMQTGYAKEDTGKPGFTAEERPSNNIFGTVMHRVFELLVERRDLIDASTKDEQVKRAINQAIIESYDDIVTNDKDDRKRYFDFLYEVLTKKGYLDRIIGIVKDAEVYTEYDFSFYVPDDERDLFMSDFKEHLEKNNITIPDGVPIWINGQADLVVKKGNSITVYDYKSDICRGRPDFEKAMENKYAGQLKLYRYAIGKSFGIKQEEVKTELIHLYLT